MNRSRSRSGPTPFGIAVFVIGAVSYIVGWQLGWIELFVVAAAGLLALVLAVPFVVGRSRLELHRSIEPPRVMVGEPGVAHLAAHNTSRRSMRTATVVESLAPLSSTPLSSTPLSSTPLSSTPLSSSRARAERGQPISRIELAVPALAGGERYEIDYVLPTDRRGTIRVGPAVLSRSDPAGLLARDVAHTAAQTLWVHPRWTLLRPLSAGFAKDLEGPTADDSPAGDIAFHAVRPYQLGDDPRHVHWMSTARTGQVMVRHYVDNRRPHLTVVVDGSAAHWRGAEFETGVEVAASLAVSSLHHRLPVATAIGSEWIIGRTQAADHDRVLNGLTICAPRSTRALILDVADALLREPATSVLVLVTARVPPDELLRCVLHSRRHARVVIVDCHADDDEPLRRVPGARIVRGRDLSGFALSWNRGLSR